MRKLNPSTQNDLPKSSFLKNVFVLATGTASAQFILIAASPILARLFTPEDFGVLAVFAAVLSLLAIISTLKYEMALPIPETDAEAVKIFWLCFVVLFTIIGLCCVGLFFFDEALVKMLGVPALAGYLWLLPIALLGGGVYRTFQYWCVRQKIFKDISSTQVVQAVTTVTTQGSGFYFGSPALIAGYVLGQLIGAMRLAKMSMPTLREHKLSAADLRPTAVEHKRFPIYLTGTGLLNTGSLHAPPILLAALFSPAIAGLYMMASRTLSAPAMVIGQAVAKVFLSEAAELHRAGTLGASVVKLHRVLLILAIPAVICAFLLAEPVFEFIFGSEWRASGEMAKWLIFSVALSFTSSPMSSVLAVVGRQDMALVTNLIILLSRVVALYLGFLAGSALIAVQYLAIASVISYTIYITVVYCCVDVKVWQVIKSYALLAIPVAAVLGAATAIAFTGLPYYSIYIALIPLLVIWALFMRRQFKATF